MLNLYNVTLFCYETRDAAMCELAAMAVAECRAKATFGDVIIATTRPSLFKDVRPFRLYVPEPGPKIALAQMAWYELPRLLNTDFFMWCSWDSWILDPEAWTDEFFDYDFCGSVWGWHGDGYEVGNSGFSLKSARLARYVSDHRDRFPVTTDAEDDLLCREYRPALEREGFFWAPVPLAHRFAFERNKQIERTFGFHGSFNFHRVLDDEAFRERQRLMLASAMIEGKMLREVGV